MNQLALVFTPESNGWVRITLVRSSSVPSTPSGPRPAPSSSFNVTDARLSPHSHGPTPLPGRPTLATSVPVRRYVPAGR